MCGIAGGFWANPSFDVEPLLSLALSRMRHRGPDDQGLKVKRHAAYTVGLGQTRLSIIDLGAGGHQPMETKNGRYSVIYNGEIYNYKELREELRERGHAFRSASDTEVLLAAWAEWGRSCLLRLEGMFAFVIYDSLRHMLTAVRDPFGIKPFFYDWGKDGVVFASEQRSLQALRSQPARPDLQQAYDYLVHGDYDSQERTFFEGVRHLLPGSMLEINLLSPGSVAPEVWWRASTEECPQWSFGDAVEAVREQFLHNIRLHLRSDVPVGTALSGGIDSSAIACAIRHVEPDMPIHTFSYIADGSDVSEEKWVDVVNEKIRAIPHKVVASADDLVRDLDAIIAVQGEPFGSTSNYAQYRVFQLARENGIAVTLDGQGADELLAGYIGYPGQRMRSLWECGQWRDMHRFARRWGGWPGRSYHRAWMYLGRSVFPDGLYRWTREALGRDFHPRWLNTKMLRDAGVVSRESRPVSKSANRGRRVMEELAYSLQYRGLPRLLRHGDRNAMAFSIESRVPFLTIPMAELLLSLPENCLISDGGETKHVFRAAMRGIVPDVILDRRDKIGFATPERAWLLRIAPNVRQWLQDAAAIPFLDRNALLHEFDWAMAGKHAFTWQVWRWVNYVRWYLLQT